MAEIVPSSNIVAINQVKASVDRSPFLYYNDIGQYWTDLGAVASLASTINSITYCGSGIVIFVNDTRHVVRSIDYGITWVDLGQFGVAGNALLSSAYCGSGVVLVSQNSGNILRSTDYGYTWTDLGAITATAARGLKYLANGIVVFGSGSGHVFRSTNYGANWADTGALAASIRAIEYVGNGQVLVGDASGNIYQSSVGNFAAAGTFGAAIPVSGGIIRSIAYVGSTVVLAVDSLGHVFRSIDSGSTWVDEGAVSPVNINIALSLGNGRVIFGNTGGHIFRSADFGLTWTDLGVAISAQPIDSAAYLGDGVVAFGNDTGHIGRNDTTFKIDETVRFITNPIKTITANTTLNGNDNTILVNAVGGAITITLPLASSVLEQVYNIKKIDASLNVVTITASGINTIDGAGSITLVKQYEARAITSDGINWWII